MDVAHVAAVTLIAAALSGSANAIWLQKLDEFFGDTTSCRVECDECCEDDCEDDDG